ncbi:hypothetical protein R6Q57_001145 [Mikania cordata]
MTGTRWVLDNKLDYLKFAKQKTVYSYFFVASALSSPDLSDTRISWAKNGIVTTIECRCLRRNWLELVNSTHREAIWKKDAYVPIINEYMENAYVSFALGPIVLPTLYFVGPKLSEEIVESYEYRRLFKLMSTQGWLLNDIRSFKMFKHKNKGYKGREKERRSCIAFNSTSTEGFKEGKLNDVALYSSNGESGNMKEEVVKEMMIMIKKKKTREN